jgi:hypothetical protein
LLDRPVHAHALGAAAWPPQRAEADVLQFVAFAWNHVGVFRLTHARPDRAVDGAAMSTELHRIEFGRFARFGGFSDHVARRRDRSLRPGLFGLPVLLIVGLVGWLVWSAYDSGSAESEPAESLTAAVETPSPPAGASENQSATPASIPPAAADAPPVNGLSISSQSWRRGGLGSKALVTFTLRNNNDYAVKDIELVCAFARSDGSHLTDRKRVIRDIVIMKSRKTFAHMLVGFVNVNASRAKCALVAASRS